MPIPKKYFHDRLIILLLGINGFLALLGSLLILFRLDASRSAGYIVEFRGNFGIGEYKTGSVVNLASFIVFLIATLILNVVLSIRTYSIRRHVSLMILSMGVLLSILVIVVSNALLVLR